MNKNSRVLALKYRPSNFDELIGQDLVSETIMNSIKSIIISILYNSIFCLLKEMSTNKFALFKVPFHEEDIFVLKSVFDINL